jgi:hypothetical protein
MLVMRGLLTQRRCRRPASPSKNVPDAPVEIAAPDMVTIAVIALVGLE